MAEQPLDPVNAAIVALTAGDGRISNRAIASAVGISEKQAATRLKRLIADEVIHFATALDVFQAGYPITLALGVEVLDRSLDEVAEELARLPQVVSVYLMGGPCRLEILVIASGHDSLVSFVKEQLSRVKGIRAFSPSIHLDIFKFRNPRGHFIPYPDDALKILAASSLDDIAKGIIRCLWEKSRATNQEIGRKLGLAEATVRARINQLREQRVIRITAIQSLDQAVFAHAFIGIELDAVHDERPVVDALGAIERISFGATVFGRYSILATAYGESLDEITQLVEKQIATLKGVRTATAIEVVKVIKYDYRLGIVLKPQGGK
jgi:Lrp/AsnC family transcriptional regulator for asnA, asnC and gidA